jgi:hypothetical protein
MPQPDPDSPLKTLALLASASGVSALLAAGLLGGLVIEFLGGPLAMGLAIWSGETTEPSNPGGSFPWPVYGAATAASILGLALSRKAEGVIARLGYPIAIGAAGFTGVLPFIWMFVLRGRT